MRPLRAKLFAAVGRLVRGLVATPVLSAFYGRRIWILYLHHSLAPTAPAAAMGSGVAPKALSRMLHELKTSFEFVPLDGLQFGSARSSERPQLAITVDDGIDPFACDLAEILSEHRAPATLFVAGDSIGNRRMLWQHRLSVARALAGDSRYRTVLASLMADANDGLAMEPRHWPMARKQELTDRLWRACGMPPEAELLEAWRPYVDWPQIDRWLASGQQLGFHTRSHPYCGRLTGPELDDEIIRPAQELLARLGKQQIAFAYPFGERAVAAEEDRIWQSGLFTMLLGTNGPSLADTPPNRWERVPAEPSLDAGLFGRPVLRALLGRS